MLEAACLFLAGERLNIRGVWEAYKALRLAPSPDEAGSLSDFTLRLQNGAEALRVASNLAVYNLMQRIDKDHMEVIHHCFCTEEYGTHFRC